MFLMRFAIAATMKIMYAPLVVQFHLSRKQADKFYQILADAGIKSAKLMWAGKLIPEDAQPMEAELQTSLGAVGFAQWQDYIQNDMNDHVMLRQIRRALASHPLSDPPVAATVASHESGAPNHGRQQPFGSFASESFRPPPSF
jgi:hypothetical protein